MHQSLTAVSSPSPSSAQSTSSNSSPSRKSNSSKPSTSGRTLWTISLSTPTTSCRIRLGQEIVAHGSRMDGPRVPSLPSIQVLDYIGSTPWRGPDSKISTTHTRRAIDSSSWATDSQLGRRKGPIKRGILIKSSQNSFTTNEKGDRVHKSSFWAVSRDGNEISIHFCS